MSDIPLDDPDDQPIRDGSNLLAFLHVLKKAHLELVGKNNAQTAIDRFNRVITKRHAKDYIDELMPQLLKEREQRRAERHKKEHR